MRAYRHEFAVLSTLLLSENYPEKDFDPKCLKERDYYEIDKLIKYVAEKAGYVFIAHENQRIVAFCHVYFRQYLDEKRMLINGLIVHPEFRRQGIARELMKISRDFAMKNDCDTLELFAGANDMAARPLYQSEGFFDSRIHMIKPLKDKVNQ